MSRKKLIMAGALVVAGVLSMWARHEADKAERRKREAVLRSLSTHVSGTRATQAPTPDDTIDEPREMFDSTLPQESLESIRQAVGQDFKLLELYVHEQGLMAKVSTDGQSVKEYRRWKNRKNVDGPEDVRLVGDGKLEENLLKPDAVDFSLLAKIAKEAKERAALPDSKVSSARFKYPFLMYKVDGPEWSLMVETGSGDSWQHKSVVFDSKGKFKRLY